MHCVSRFSRLIAVSLALVAAAAPICHAHFAWLATDDQGRAVLFFGESPHERDYKLPEAVVAAKVFQSDAAGKRSAVELKSVEEDDFIGRRSEKAASKDAALVSTVTYGVYHGMLLDYFVKGLTAVDPAKWESSAKSKTLKLNPTPRVTEKGLDVVVLWEDKPLAAAKVTMIDADGSPTDAETNANGVAQFEAPPEGLVGFLVNRTDDKAEGKIDDQEYTSAGQYATVTIMYKKPSADAKPSPAAAASAAASPLPALPEPVSSFGGAVCDGWLYVYGGHIGTEHDHSKENLSAHFRRVKLNGGNAWEELPMQTPLQGLPLVTHGGKLYRVGGMNARNTLDKPEDLHSVAEFACYDPATSKWADMPPLPEARSSHDAVVIGDTLYVVGGWTLNGPREGEWLPTAWAFDLAKPDAKWQAIAAPTFKRRALAVATWDRKLVALGGMNENAKVSKNAFVLDPATNQWTALPDLPGEGQMRGFGVSAWDLAGGLFVSGADGIVSRLADDGASWESAGKLLQARFFHRLLPLDGSTLLAVAGASFSDGHLANIEQFAPPSHN